MLTALLLAAACSAPPAIALAGDYAKLSAGVESLADPGGDWQLADVAAAPRCLQFAPVHGTASLGATEGALWLRLRLQVPPGPTPPWRLLLRFGGLDRACVYWPLVGGAIRTDCATRAQGLGSLGHTAAGDLFALPPGLDASRPVYLRAHSDVWLKAPLEVGTADALLRHEHRAQFGWGLYYGFLLTIVLVSFVLYLGRRDRAFLYFSLQIATVTAALAVWQGRFAVLDAWLGGSALRLAPVLTAVFLALGTRFYRRLLDTDRHLPRLDRLLDLCFWLAVGLAFALFFERVHATRLLGLVALGWVALGVLAAICRLRQRFRPALAVLAAMGVLLGAVAVNAMEVIGAPLLDPDAALALLYLGVIPAAGFLVLGLALRVLQLARQRDHATELAQASQQLALHRSRFDDLTGLPNRAKFSDDVSERLIAAPPSHARHALVTLGLDRFRAINHALGHEGGDAVLQEIAARLRAAVPPDDLVARIGPDLFGWFTAIHAGGAHDDGDFPRRCAQLRQALGAPLQQALGSTLSASLGVARYPEHGLHADSLLRHSDEALYRAKERGGGIVEEFEPALQLHADRYLELNKDLRKALDEDALALHYQPIVMLEGGALVGVEALLRWRRPDGRWTPPEQFIPVAESSDLIDRLTDWVFRTACAQMGQWRRHGVPVPVVSVNVSPRQFSLPDVVERVARAIGDAGIDGDAVEIELTEGALLENLEATRDVLSRLRARRIGIAVDDFGVGYSSLNYLRNLPVSTIKIDRAFLRGIPDEPEAIAVIAAMIALGRDLGLRVVAEGVETGVQHEFLRSREVPCAQGFLICHPLPAAELEAWLRGRDPELVAA